MTKITLLSNLFQILQTRFELVRLAPTDFKSVVYTVPPPEDNLLYHVAGSVCNHQQQIYYSTNLVFCHLILLSEDINIYKSTFIRHENI